MTLQKNKRVDYLIMCIGNVDGGDDAIGPYIAEILSQEKDFVVLDCGTVPENYTSVVKKQNPKNLILIDAVEMGLSPGEIRIVPKERIGVMHISTHGIPLSVLIRYLEQYIDHIILIGIQPQTMSGKMSDKVKSSGERLINTIKNKNLDKIKKLEIQK